MQTRPQLIQLLLLLSICEITSAFSAHKGSSNIVQSKSTMSLRSASLDEKPKWVDLPSPRVEKGDDRNLDGAEITIGRVAMVGFLALFFNEVASGESFGQQILDGVMVATGNH